MHSLDQQLAYAPLGATQRRTLALMEVDVYQRRRLPRAPTAPGVGEHPRGWDAVQAELPLARAIARAAGSADAAAWSATWAAGGAPLPDLPGLRAESSAKRALWRLLRARLPRS